MGQVSKRCCEQCEILTSIVRFLTFMILVVLKGIHEQGTSYQTSTTREERRSHTRAGLLRRTLLDVRGLLWLGSARTEPTCQCIRSVCEHLHFAKPQWLSIITHRDSPEEEVRRTARDNRPEGAVGWHSTRRGVGATGPTEGVEDLGCSPGYSLLEADTGYCTDLAEVPAVARSWLGAGVQVDVPTKNEEGFPAYSHRT